ncbi:hypothetical protein E3N88_22571 [Mikania micrantha]|uniref:Solute carrier family 40 member n=1 Tax=Mikania micrantha TaxID=192012 RepID=A0A5N6NCJ8_9ASTR|nr:hypothetical protein E3N88_22571 [Mikania micrantha]
MVAGVTVVGLLISPDTNATKFTFLVVLTNLSGAVAVLSTLAGTILIERECFGTLMTATLEWDAIPAYVIGMGRGISAIVGISATFLYPFMETRLSTLRTGLWSIWSQWTCLLICVGSIWVKNNTASAYLLMSGVAMSRLGLWVFDLSVIQQMQDQVSESDRAVVGGVQNSIQSFWDLMTYIMGLIISNPQPINSTQ